ncbi:MAG: lactonase family protein [Terriglobia bacterium]
MKITWTSALLLVPLVTQFDLISAGQLSAKPPAKGKYLVYIGTYTGQYSKGIYAYEFESRNGQLKRLGLVGETPNPSYLAIHPSQPFLYAVNEVDNYEGKKAGSITAFAFDARSGKLTLLNAKSTRDADPCYVTVDKTGRYALVANYGGGNVAAIPIGKDGRLGEASAFIQHTGHGTNPERQEGPHAHSINLSPDNRFAVAADLGLDELLVYRFDPTNGSLIPNDPPFAKVQPGAGPRHFDFHPRGKFAYAICEMGSIITAFAYDAAAGTLQELQTISTLPKDYAGSNDDADIHVHPSGRFLYGSNRGHDSIAVFAIDPDKGTLTLVEHVSTQGKTPRNFGIDPSGSYLFAANQDSDNIVVFHIDSKSGRLTPTGQTIEVPSPVCVKFAAAE